MMGTFEIVELGMVIVVSLGLAYTAVERRHVTVDVFISHFSVKIQNILEGIMSLLGGIFFLIMGWQLGVRIWEGNMRMVGVTSISEAPFMFAATVGCLTLCIVLFQNVSRISRTGKRG
jgi:TRAP-type C4-dicarboxylate transport system permease small subunit